MCKCYENNVFSLNTAKTDPIQACIRVKIEYFQFLFSVRKKNEFSEKMPLKCLNNA